MSDAETAAIIAFLSLNVPEFKKLARFGGVLKKLVNASQVEERDVNEDEERVTVVGLSSVAPHRVEANTIENFTGRRLTLKENRSTAAHRSQSSVENVNKSDVDLLNSGPIFAKGSLVTTLCLFFKEKFLVHAGSR